MTRKVSIRSPKLDSPKKVIYVVYCHGLEDPTNKITVPHHLNGETFRLDYYVQCGHTLWGGINTLQGICNADITPTLTILSGNLANNMYFSGDNNPALKMGVYVCSGNPTNIKMIFPMGPSVTYNMETMISMIMRYHAQAFGNTGTQFSISLHNCRSFEGDPIRTVQMPVNMNPETVLAEQLAKSLKITDDFEPEEGLYNPVRKVDTFVKTLQQRKEEEEVENAQLQMKINELTDTLTKMSIRNSPIRKVKSAKTKPKSYRKKSLVKHSRLENPKTKRLTLAPMIPATLRSRINMTRNTMRTQGGQTKHAGKTQKNRR
jgi:hypothetical protein